MLEEELPNIAHAAQLFGVLEQQLWARWKGSKLRTHKPPIGQKLSERQELALCHYFDQLDQMGIAAQHLMLNNCVNAIFERSH